MNLKLVFTDVFSFIPKLGQSQSFFFKTLQDDKVIIIKKKK